MIRALLCLCLLVFAGFLVAETPAAPSVPQKKYQIVNSLQLGYPVRCAEAAPVRFKGRDCLLIRYSSIFAEDPWEDAFHYPRDTYKLALFDLTDNHKMWEFDLTDDVPTGYWFCPVLVCDIDQDGNDEIFYVDTNNPGHQLTILRKVVELDVATGRPRGSFPIKIRPDRMDECFRIFLAAGRGKDGKMLLCHLNGTYKNLYLTGYTRDGKVLWTREIPRNEGPRSSHCIHTFDADGDGVDDLLWGERMVRFSDGSDVFVVDDPGNTNSHPDIAIPIFDGEGKYIANWFCREGSGTGRVVLTDNKGKVLWKKIDKGHMHSGCVFRIDAKGTKVLGAHGADKKNKMSGNFYYTMDGKDYPQTPELTKELPISVDLDGDGVHELYFRSGDKIVHYEKGWIGVLHGGSQWFYSRGHFRSDLPGEVILSLDREKKIFHLVADPDAKWSDSAKKRYANPAYQSEMRNALVGYTWARGLGGI